MTPIRFSIATPTRNALGNLKRCVGSVRGQHGVAYEHLVQDARSTDGTPDWLATQAALNAVSEPDDGMYDAINRAWARGSGEFYSWLNADEQYLPGTLALVAAYFDANPEVDVVFGDYIVADAQGRPVALRREIPFRHVYVVNSFLNMYSATIFFRRRLFDRGLMNLDSRYRYAADKELILRLAAEGAVIRHLPRYLAVFGIDGSNLSTHPGVAKEVESIRLAHGAFRSHTLRGLALLGRRFERLMRGGYRASTVSYLFALDEKPWYAAFEACRLGGRYTLNDIEGRDGTRRTVESQ